ncbi:hypothetical protein Aph02nite_26040 [Actinoplanes philippinensis]|nr:hypothetical protein [Actinoplanes philippinensis]GIE76654.1 hypothetical protein Aph02nite_26040 [Actinoplanes philippinensis]
MTASAGDLLAAVVARAMADFAGRNAYVHGGNAVHAVATVRWLGELEVPAPLCHVGVSGGELAALRPTTRAVTCRRCLRRQGADELAALPSTEQLTLFPARR